MLRSPRSLRLSFATLALVLSNLAFGAEPTAPVFAPKLQPAVDQNILPGAVVLVANRDRILHLEAVGYSDLKSKRPMQVDDLFWIASMSKSMSAAAFMILVDEGKVGLEDSVEKYLPEFKTLKVAQADGTQVPPSHPITIREILSHTSGLRFLNHKDRQLIDSVPLATSVEHSLLEPLLFDPGTKYQYSNEGIDAAGRIIEIVSGEPFEKFVQDRLFTPLGMVDTTFKPTAAQLQRLAKSYRTNAENGTLEELNIVYLSYPLDGAARYPAPGGGLFSTASDVARFCQMLANGGSLAGKTILSKDAVRQMTTKQTGPLIKENYGFGTSATDGQVFGHGGAYQTSMTVDHGLIRVFLVQHTGKWSNGDPASTFTAAVRALNLTKSTDSSRPEGILP